MEKNKKQANKAGKSKEKAASRGKSESKDSGKPKRIVIPSGYLLYGKEYREKHKGEKVSVKEIADNWKNLSEQERAKFNDQSAKMKSANAANEDEKPNKKADKKAGAKPPKDEDKKEKKKPTVSKNKKKQEEESEEEAGEDED